MMEYYKRRVIRIREFPLREKSQRRVLLEQRDAISIGLSRAIKTRRTRGIELDEWIKLYEKWNIVYKCICVCVSLSARVCSSLFVFYYSKRELQSTD